MDKRGVSPLIATVLIIAFVIILFALVTTWTRRAALEPAMQTGEEEIASTLECADIDLKINEACVNTLANPTLINVTVDNTGSRDVYNIKIRAIGAIGVDVITPDPAVGIISLDRGKARDETVAGTTTGQINRVEVYPVLTGDRTCQGRFVSTTIVPLC